VASETRTSEVSDNRVIEDPNTQFLGESSNRRIFPVVGIGASAGGLEALEEFFRALQPDCGMAFIIIQHLSPDFKSFMPEILQRCTNTAVYPAEDGMPIEPNALYVLPPKMNLRIVNHCIKLTPIEKTNIPNRPIDLFFQSLAKDAGERAAAVVLSGTGSDGAVGIRSVHDNGGIVLVQSPESAKFDGMPRSALATNVVDASGRAAELAQSLVSIVNHSEETEDVPGVGTYLKSDMKRLFTLIEEQYDVDFSLYKKPTIHRRISKRLETHDCKDIGEYIKVLQKDPKEITTLYYDMLIGVTQFFRDAEAFTILEQKVIPKIFKQKTDEEDIRVWIPGCASGEEVYSIAILLFEYARVNKRKCGIKLFGTDIDDGVLAKATEGTYKKELVACVRPSLRDRYFTEVDGKYRISSEIRKSIVFARHNILKDPPFTKMDLVTCRNLLIYFDNDAQRDAMSYLYFALQSSGFLFLGPSETLGKFEQGYNPIDVKWKTYQKLSNGDLPKTFRNVFSSRDYTSMPLAVNYKRTKAKTSPQAQAFESAELRLAFNGLMQEYVPPSLLVNSNMDLIHIFGEAGKYLRNRPGPIESNLKFLLSDKLGLAVNVAMQRARKENTRVSHKGIVNEDDGTKLDLHVQPVSKRVSFSSSHFLVSFEAVKDVSLGQEESKATIEVDAHSDTYEKIKALEIDLQETKENLQATIEELETTNEELQSTNEELLAANEELQSTNEELHSVNEELYTVNTEYQNKIDDLTQMTNDEENFLKSTKIGTIFLSPSFHVRKYTPAIVDAFNLLPQDIDRPIAHITHKLDINLLEIIDNVAKTGSEVEFETFTKDGRCFIGKVMPYTTRMGDFDGIVLTFTDTTKIKNELRKNREREQVLRQVIEELSDGWWDQDLAPSNENLFMSPKLKSSLGYKDYEIPNTVEGQRQLLASKDRQKYSALIEEHIKNRAPFDEKISCIHKDGSEVDFRVRGQILYAGETPIRLIAVQSRL